MHTFYPREVRGSIDNGGWSLQLRTTSKDPSGTRDRWESVTHTLVMHACVRSHVPTPPLLRHALHITSGISHKNVIHVKPPQVFLLIGAVVKWVLPVLSSNLNADAFNLASALILVRIFFSLLWSELVWEGTVTELCLRNRIRAFPK